MTAARVHREHDRFKDQRYSARRPKMMNHFTTEIGRMRNEEMISRGVRYQRIQALKRQQEESSERHRAPRTSPLRVLGFAGLSVAAAVGLTSIVL